MIINMLLDSICHTFKFQRRTWITGYAYNMYCFYAFNYRYNIEKYGSTLRHKIKSPLNIIICLNLHIYIHNVILQSLQAEEQFSNAK